MVLQIVPMVGLWLIRTRKVNLRHGAAGVFSAPPKIDF